MNEVTPGVVCSVQDLRSIPVVACLTGLGSACTFSLPNGPQHYPHVGAELSVPYSHYKTSDPRVLVRSDGTLVPHDGSISIVDDPTAEEVSIALESAGGRAIYAATKSFATMSNSGGGLFPHHQSKLEKKVQAVYEKIPGVGHYFEFIFKLTELITDEHDPMIELVQSIETTLFKYFEFIDKQVFASFSATRLAMLSNLQGMATSALDTVVRATSSQQAFDNALANGSLANADSDSSVPLNQLLAGGVDGGYWRRPYSGPAIDLDQWSTRFDQRAPLYGDGTVWDPRLGLPTLSYLLAVRIVVLRALYRERKHYCRELKRYVKVLLAIQQRWQEGLQRKLELSAYEKAYRGGFSVVPFAAGAIDVFTGFHHAIDVDDDALNLLQALGLLTIPLPSHIEALSPADVDQTITSSDVDLRFPTYKAILAKQSSLSFTMVRWGVGLQDFCEMIKAIGAVCTEPVPLRDAAMSTFNDAFLTVSGRGLSPGQSVNQTLSRCALAKSLTEMVHEGERRGSQEAMRDQYLLYAALREEGPLKNQLTELIASHLQAQSGMTGGVVPGELLGAGPSAD
jgi:hypothetical protein